MSTIWFTSDTHFGHKNIVKGCSDWPDKDKVCRDFQTIEEHDDYLVDQLNKKVKPADILYHLGDFGLGVGYRDKLPELRGRIQCETIYLAKGNHDHLFENQNKTKYPELFSLFKDIRDIYYKKISNRLFVLCHYAMLTWPWQHHKSYQLYGHSHSNLPDNPESLSMDVGVDTSLFGHQQHTPYSLEEIEDIMQRSKRFVAVDHHG